MKKWTLASLAMALVIALGTAGFAAEAKKAPFDKDSCCAKKAAAGAVCDHPCCVEALKKNESCKKCNKEAGGKSIYAKDSCCAKKAAEGKGCDHPCCAKAAKEGTVCEKCNKEEAKKEAKK